MQISKILHAGLLCALSFVAFAQQANVTLHGQVRSEDGETLPGASVSLKGTSHGTFTNADGKYTIEHVRPGSYKLLVSFMGYQTQTKDITLKPGEHFRHNIKLVSETRELESVSVIGRTETKEINRQAYNVTAIDAKKLQNSTLDLSHALDRVSGVRVRESGGVGSNMNFSLNGFTGRQVKFFLDGVPMDNFGSSFQLNNIPINLAERVEVYKGVVPIWLGSDALGGAVNIVTNTRQNSYLDASYSYGSFNTHRTTINAGFTAKNGFTAQLNAFQNYSDNNYWITVDVADVNTGEYFRNQRLRRFHDTYHNETVIANVGLVGKKFADRLLLGITLGKNKAEIQTGARMVSVFGQWHRKGNIVMPSLKYQKKDLFVKGLNVNISANYNLGQEQNVDTVYRRYNWFQQFKQYEGKGSERERSLYKFRNNNGLATANVTYQIDPRHSVTINNVFNTFNRKGEDELFPESAKYEQPRVNRKNVLGLGYKFDYNERWNTSLFLKHFSQNNKFSVSYNPTGNWGDEAFLVQKNSFEKLGYGIASTYFLFKNFQLKGSFEKSYRLPETDELFGDLLNLEGNINLDPETSYNYNLGFSYNGAINRVHRFSVDANVLYRDAQGFIRPRLNANQTKQVMDNLADVTNFGIDGEVRYSFRQLFTAGANLTYQNLRNNTRFEEGYTTESPLYRDRIPNMPFLFGNADAAVFFKDLGKKGNTLTLGYNLLYVHAYYLYWPSLGSDKLDIPQQLSHDVNLVYAMADGRYNVSLECKNLLDAKLFDNFSLQKPSRGFYVKLRYFISK
ncbi:outer membrane cobalamin receptor [Dyadobacter sp. BE34]|uniref:Outer membrane cobalamin receptor n=1 Tax=Dyadobacter fermentans TaxID=94254 RepID=A0ABU1QVU7_9BACT|nr:MULTISPECIES: TonB-dependent receptor [Dyadobacter]MDR6805282.1 outer membrane cobalamin receptor [Dyadobacter fermentans]MDR7042958.1 outer membrane cobalamin receptor [Dyadobacter sp. BE242]MDR7197270.1 outer membrane cobalamin receptor [Dyadobacter sp. BE34]MDR7215295.1 outer membrane cobalamin receptor [Dyadobacter sp. BE31]MDR7262831.1 outer membrane cobalamin receptor [Dyadobacter sp. BE32]